MSTTDLFTDDFPHGTPAGFEKGCRGAACPNHIAGERTCKQAHLLYQSDYGYRRAVDAGVEYVEPQAAPRPEIVTPVKKAKPVPAPAPTPAPKPVAPKPTPTPAAEVDPPAEEYPHGTYRGYQRGCRKDDECPGEPTTAKTCRTAQREYMADWRRKKAERDQAAAAPAPVEPQTESHWIDDVLEPVAEVAPSQESPLAPPAESLALAMLRTQLADATDQRDLAVGALDRAKERNVQLELELDVAKAAARIATSRIPQIEYRDFPQAVPAAPVLTIDPTDAGGVKVILAGVTGTATLALMFAEHGLQDVNVTIKEQAA